MCALRRRPWCWLTKRPGSILPPMRNVGFAPSQEKEEEEEDEGSEGGPAGADWRWRRRLRCWCSSTR